jgi:ABC-type dipeptide/oligopeptide/nickel transport system permease component
MGDVVRYIARRLVLYLPMLLLTLLVFMLMRVIPGDPALLILAGSGEGSFSRQELANPGFHP